MERSVTSTEANQRFAEILRDVVTGDSVTITSHGRAVAKLIPAPDRKRPTAEDMKAMWAFFDEVPPVVTGPWTRDDLYDRNW